MEPLVSIVMPAYNAEKYIGEAIQSIINQSYCNWELVIVEDCSTDNTYNEIRKFDDERIILLKNLKNKGIAYTTNRGIAESHGDFIALHDDDDISLPNRIENELKFLILHTNIDVVGARSIEINKVGEIITYCDVPKKNPKYIKAELLFHMVNFTNSTLMFRKKFICNYAIKIEEDCYGTQDFKFYIDCSKVGNLTAMDEPLLKHRIYDTSTTKRMLTIQPLQRKKAYEKIQRSSLLASGFLLDEKEFQTLFKATGEHGVICNTLQEFIALQGTLKKILHQAVKMNIDYYNELSIVCRKILFGSLSKLDVFDFKF